VQIVRDYTGRGPTKAGASIRDDVVTVLMQETLLKAKHSLINDDKGALVVEMRRSFQQTMRGERSAAVERLTKRKVIAFMSDRHGNTGEKQGPPLTSRGRRDDDRRRAVAGCSRVRQRGSRRPRVRVPSRALEAPNELRDRQVVAASATTRL
jgi:uncharacterized protein YbcI